MLTRNDKKDKMRVVYFSSIGYYFPEQDNGKLVFRRVADECGSDVPEDAIKIVSFRECYEKFDSVFEVLSI